MMTLSYKTKDGILRRVPTEGGFYESRLVLLMELTKLQTRLELDAIESVFIDGVEKAAEKISIEKWALFHALATEKGAA